MSPFALQTQTFQKKEKNKRRKNGGPRGPFDADSNLPKESHTDLQLHEKEKETKKNTKWGSKKVTISALQTQTCQKDVLQITKVHP